jgi:hypothetical protein
MVEAVILAVIPVEMGEANGQHVPTIFARGRWFAEQYLDLAD